MLLALLTDSRERGKENIGGLQAGSMNREGGRANSPPAGPLEFPLNAGGVVEKSLPGRTCFGFVQTVQRARPDASLCDRALSRRAPTRRAPSDGCQGRARLTSSCC